MDELAEHGTAPRRPALADGIDAAVACVDARASAVGEREALAVDADSLDHDGIRRDAVAIAAEETAVEASPQQPSPEHSSVGDHTPGDGAELERGPAVEQSLRAGGVVAGDRGEDDERERDDAQPVQPHRPTPP
jgi:hypothetical protein